MNSYETDQEGACKVAERLRDVVAGLRLTHGAPGGGPLVTLSIGIATQIPGDDVCAEWLVRQADQALYAARHSGRNRVVSADNVLATFARAGGERDQQTTAISDISQRVRRR